MVEREARSGKWRALRGICASNLKIRGDEPAAAMARRPVVRQGSVAKVFTVQQRPAARVTVLGRRRWSGAAAATGRGDAMFKRKVAPHA